MKFAYLDGHDVALTEDMDMWLAESVKRHATFEETGIDLYRVGLDESESGDIGVSTVFLGLDTQCFESMWNTGPDQIEFDRYDTWAEAEAGHAVIKERLGL